MRLLGRLADGREESKPSAMSGDLVIESEFVDELGATVTVARLRTDSSVSASELLQALVNVKVTELSDEAFALTGVEVRGASKFAQVWDCEVDAMKSVAPEAAVVASAIAAVPHTLSA